MIAPIVRMVFGVLFIASAIFKLFPIEAFEMVLIKQVGFSWALAPAFARFLIIAEFGLGLCIAFGMFTRTMIMASIAMLIGFSIFLVNQILGDAGAENCGCFGELIPMDAPTSIGKNMVFLAIAVFLLGSKSLNKWVLRWMPLPLMVIAIPVLLYFLPMPEANLDKEATIDTALIEEVNELHQADFLEGDIVMVMLYSRCVHCKQLANLLATANNGHKLRVIMFGSEDSVEEFVVENNIDQLKYYPAKSRKLMQAFNGTFPTVIYVREGEVVSNWTGTEVNKDLLTQILGE